MKFVFALAALLCTAAFGQAFSRNPQEYQLLAPKRSPISLELYRSSYLCGGLRDCADTADTSNAHLGLAPCASNPLSCHLAIEKRDYTLAPVGGFKISGTLGPVTLSLGRHGDNPLLAHSPVLEGSYQLGEEGKLHFGVVEHSDPTGRRHPMAFFLWKKPL